MDTFLLVLDQLAELRSDPLNFAYPQHLLEQWKALTNDLAANYDQHRHSFEQRQIAFAQRQALFEQQRIKFEQRRSQFRQQHTEWQAHPYIDKN
jgi:t-SNARE complex subunit (syntaxin)